MESRGPELIPAARSEIETYLWVILLDPGDASDLGKAGERHGVVTQRVLVCRQRVFQIPHLLGHTTCTVDPITLARQKNFPKG